MAFLPTLHFKLLSFAFLLSFFLKNVSCVLSVLKCLYSQKTQLWLARPRRCRGSRPAAKPHSPYFKWITLPDFQSQAQQCFSDFARPSSPLSDTCADAAWGLSSMTVLVFTFWYKYGGRNVNEGFGNVFPLPFAFCFFFSFPSSDLLTLAANFLC